MFACFFYISSCTGPALMFDIIYFLVFQWKILAKSVIVQRLT